MGCIECYYYHYYKRECDSLGIENYSSNYYDSHLKILNTLQNVQAVCTALSLCPPRSSIILPHLSLDGVTSPIPYFLYFRWIVTFVG